LENRGQDIAGLHFRTLGALDVEDGRLQDAAEGGGLLRLAFCPRRTAWTDVQYVQVLAQAGGPPCRPPNPLALPGRARARAVLQREYACARDRLTAGDGQTISSAAENTTLLL
jgi:hypothetical protein